MDKAAEVTSALTPPAHGLVRGVYLCVPPNGAEIWAGALRKEVHRTAPRRSATERGAPDRVLLPHGLRARNTSGRRSNTYRASSTGETVRLPPEACSRTPRSPPNCQSQR